MTLEKLTEEFRTLLEENRNGEAPEKLKLRRRALINKIGRHANAIKRDPIAVFGEIWKEAVK